MYFHCFYPAIPYGDFPLHFVLTEKRRVFCVFKEKKKGSVLLPNIFRYRTEKTVFFFLTLQSSTYIYIYK